MGLFGKKKSKEEETASAKVLESAVTSEDTTTESASEDASGNNLDDFDYDYDGNKLEENEEGSSDSDYKGVTGDKIVAELHKSDALKDKMLGGVGGIADMLGDLSVESISEAYTEKHIGVRAKTIAFFGAGGGVGTSTVMLELISRIAERRKRILVIDLNVMGGIIELLLRSPIKGKREDLYTLLGKTSDLSNTIGIVGSTSTLGFRGRGMDALASVDAMIYAKAYDDLIAEVSGAYDFIFVDCGSDINFCLANNALYRADAGYIITDGGLSSIQKLGILKTCFRYCGIYGTSFGVIVNKNTRAIQSVVSDLGYRFAGQIPYLLSIKNANLQGKLLKNDFVYSENAGVVGAKEEFDRLAAEIVTPDIPALNEGDYKEDMEFDKERKAEQEEDNA